MEYCVGKKFRNVCISLCIFMLGSMYAGCGSADERSDEFGKVMKNINGEPVIPREANRIIIPDFQNATSMPALGKKITLGVRELISQDGRLAVVTDEAVADLILHCKISLYQIQPMQFDTSGLPVKKRMRITASVKLDDRVRGKQIFYEREVQAFETYSDVIPPIYSETAMQEKVIESLARRIAAQTVSGWYTDLMTKIEKGKK